MTTTIEQRLYNGDRAREILENEVFQQVFTDYRQEITDQWMKSPARDQEGRERLWVFLAHLNKLEAMIQTTLDTGKLAKKDLEYRQSMQERIKSLIGSR
jgi:hypothetical protein